MSRVVYSTKWPTERRGSLKNLEKVEYHERDENWDDRRSVAHSRGGLKNEAALDYFSSSAKDQLGFSTRFSMVLRQGKSEGLTPISGCHAALSFTESFLGYYELSLKRPKEIRRVRDSGARTNDPWNMAKWSRAKRLMYGNMDRA